MNLGVCVMSLSYTTTTSGTTRTTTPLRATSSSHLCANENACSPAIILPFFMSRNGVPIPQPTHTFLLTYMFSCRVLLSMCAIGPSIFRLPAQLVSRTLLPSRPQTTQRHLMPRRPSLVVKPLTYTEHARFASLCATSVVPFHCDNAAATRHALQNWLRRPTGIYVGPALLFPLCCPPIGQRCTSAPERRAACRARPIYKTYGHAPADDE